jgi:hypothetical protein
LSTASSNNEANSTNTAALDKADAKLEGIRNEIDLYERRNEIVLLGAKAETQALQLKLQSISMNPAMTAFNVRMNELKAVGTHLNQEEQVFLYEQIKQQQILAFLVMLVLIPRLPAQVVLVFAMHANQVGILKHHRMTTSVKNAQQATCKALKALFHVNRWVPMPLDWVVVLQKSWYHQDRI